MGKGKKVPGLNTSSTADISFILLIFFLVTTSMDTDQGLGRTLPKPPEDEQQKNDIKVKERNMLYVRVNKDNEIMYGDEIQGGFSTTPKMDRHNNLIIDPADVARMKDLTKRFISNKENNKHFPILKRKVIPLVGPIEVTENHVISVQTDRGTNYGVYFQLQDIVVSAYNELRDELAKETFGHKFEICNEAQQKAIRDVYPQKISEAEPRKYGKEN